LGQTSLGQTTNASTTAGANIGNAISNAGSALGAGQVAQGNALTNAGSSAANQYMLSQLLAPKTSSMGVPAVTGGSYGGAMNSVYPANIEYYIPG